MINRWQEFRCSPVGHVLGLNMNCEPEAPLPVPLIGPGIPVTEMRSIDRRIALALHRRTGEKMSWLMRRSTDLASGQVTVPIALCLVTWEVRRGRQKSARAIAVTWIGGLMLQITVKLIYRRKRPALFPVLTQAGGYSLPSGHTMTAVVTYGLAASTVRPYLPRFWRWLPATLATAIVTTAGTSRVYLGVHYPSDVLAGALIGLGWLRGSLNALSRIEREYAGRLWRRRPKLLVRRLVIA